MHNIDDVVVVVVVVVVGGRKGTIQTMISCWGHKRKNN